LYRGGGGKKKGGGPKNRRVSCHTRHGSKILLGKGKRKNEDREAKWKRLIKKGGQKNLQGEGQNGGSVTNGGAGAGGGHFVTELGYKKKGKGGG